MKTKNDIGGSLAALDDCFNKMAVSAARARAAHASTEAEMHATKGQMAACQDHLEALLAGDGHGGLSEPAPVDRAAAVARRKAKLDGLDRAAIGRAVRPSAPRELGGAYLAEEIRAGQQAAIWAAYGVRT